MTEQEQRAAFTAAIVKLADDAGFRRSFMTHYQQWLFPPILMNGAGETLAIDMQPGAMTMLTEEQFQKARVGKLMFVAK